VEKTRAFLGSPLFFWLTIGFFAVQAAWIALSALYPQAFDEQFHFGIIQVYSHHWLPFLKGNWPNAAPFGAISRDPSFLFHYAMSFPLRIIQLFTHDQTIQIILLRLINVALFAAGLVLFRRVLLRAGLSGFAANAGIFVTSLIPVAPQLAGQINYDNLLIPLTAWACLLTFGVIDQLQKRHVALQQLLGLLTVCLVASMVKYEFLPIFLGIVIFLAVFAWKRLRGRWQRTLKSSAADWQKAKAVKWLLVVVFLGTVCLFAQRDLGNIVRYHTVVPDCSQVLEIQQCSAYNVWVHDYQSHKAVVDHDAHVNPSPVNYTGEWVYWLWYRLFFAINGPDSGFRNYPPLPLPVAAFAVLVVASAIALTLRWRQVFAGRPYLRLLGVVVAVYLLTLFGAGYIKYLETGVLELMNGRYLFPILLPGAAIGATALAEFTRGWQADVRYACALVLMLCLLEGGGVFTFISRSDTSWYWPNPTVQRINADAHSMLEPITLDGPRYYSSGKWFFN